MAAKNKDTTSVGKDGLLTVETVSIEAVRANPENARLHPAENIESIKASLERFGQRKPIVLDADGVIIAGNGTYAAAVELGWKTITVSRSGLSGAEATAYGLADNKPSDQSYFDPDALSVQLEFLGDHEIDMEAFGFRDDPKEVAGDKDAESTAEAEAKVKLKKHLTLAPPAMAWVLIGIPTVRYGEIEGRVKAIAAAPGVTCETVVMGDARSSDED